jgi:hypothetical protein
MGTTREYVQSIQDRLLTLNGSYSEAVISDADFDAATVQLENHNRSTIQDALSDSLRKTLIKYTSGWIYGVTEVLPGDDALREAEDRLRFWGSYLAEIQGKLDAVARVDAERAAELWRQEVEDLPPLPDPEKVSAETLKADLAARADVFAKVAAFQTGKIVAPLLIAAGVVMVGWAFFQGLLVRAMRAGKG